MWRVITFCLFYLFYSVNSNPLESGDLAKYGPFRLALYSRVIKCNLDKSLNKDVSETNVHFYDFSKNFEKKFPISEAAEGIPAIPNLDLNRKFIVFVGGFKSHIEKYYCQKAREAFKKLPNSYLIIVDHHPYTNNDSGTKSGYETAVSNVYYIGRAIGKMLAGLAKQKIPPQNIHCIGHSLGGQMLGFAGGTFAKIMGRKIGRITALDPAGPCFANTVVENQVRSGLADYVEVYHCNSGGLGSSSVLADIDFFANKDGAHQPTCGTPLIPEVFFSAKAATCSHRTCVTMYLETVSHQDWFSAYKCINYKLFKKGSCKKNEMTKAGFWNPGNSKGQFYFSTKGFEIPDRK